MAEVDPLRAVELVGLLPAGSGRELALGAVAANWVRTDRDGALAWVESLPEGSEKNAVFSRFGQSRGTLEPRQAFDFALSMAPGVPQQELVKAIARGWSQQDVSGARQTLDSLPDGELRTAFLTAFVETMSVSSPPCAAEYVSSLPAASQSGFAAMVTRSGMRREPHAPASWVANLPDGDEKLRVLDAVLTSWAANDARGSAAWIDALPAGASRQMAMIAYVQQVTPKRPDLAAPFVTRLADRESRHTGIEFVARQWIQSDRAAAQRWLATTDLPEAERRRLLQE